MTLSSKTNQFPKLFFNLLSKYTDTHFLSEFHIQMANNEEIMAKKLIFENFVISEFSTKRMTNFTLTVSARKFLLFANFLKIAR